MCCVNSYRSMSSSPSRTPKIGKRARGLTRRVFPRRRALQSPLRRSPLRTVSSGCADRTGPHINVHSKMFCVKNTLLNRSRSNQGGAPLTTRRHSTCGNSASRPDPGTAAVACLNHAADRRKGSLIPTTQLNHRLPHSTGVALARSRRCLTAPSNEDMRRGFRRRVAAVLCRSQPE